MTFFSSANSTFSGINHKPGHRTSLSEFKRIEIISSIFSDSNGMKQDINHRKRKEKRQVITCKLDNTILKNQWVNMNSKRKLKIIPWDKYENTITKNLWNAAKAILRQKFIAMQAFLKRKTRKIPNKLPNLPPKRIRERTDKT